MAISLNKNCIPRYHLTNLKLSAMGSDYFINHSNSRTIANLINRSLNDQNHQDINASLIYAMGVYINTIEEIIGKVYKTENIILPPEIYDFIQDKIDDSTIRSLIKTYTQEFEYDLIQFQELDIANDDHVLHSTFFLGKFLINWLINQNPAFLPEDLFDNKVLINDPYFNLCIDLIKTYFDDPNNRIGEKFIDQLLIPGQIYPDDLIKQLDYINRKWGYLLDNKTLSQLLRSIDVLKENRIKLFGPGPGPINIPDYKNIHQELPEKYSDDEDWMDQLVLIAKNTYVWLHQLSKYYQKEIKTLDQIPDEILDDLSNKGITGLWLIGIWERSKASAKIKQLCGNREAISSAYAITEYQIAEDLGGIRAYQKLKQKALDKGIRMGCDMVPNHTSIDSRWIYDHPEWFISLDECPYPSYTFNGPNLSNRDDIEIYLEDHYYDRSDAAIVFKRFDKNTGKTLYIYHGNDGTIMPWNDTAQLNYLFPDVRNAILNTIESLAKEFPIIRFDAAMTLTQKHYQRLWFPEPGKGGDIPTRSEFGMKKSTFTKLMPQEFWIEVVDKISKETPDTLLLAEAFWMMESYFVRTLGMHRVYNSAFMNLLRDEDNKKFRDIYKETLEYDPQIIKRFVNFMNNPDERTAIDQFGKGDKYFGICTLLATLPGLPMFGHGQFEGFSEKYGMEYQKAYLDEIPDQELLEQHNKKIVPLLKMRNRFSRVDQFYMYDFKSSNDLVNENIIAFSNGNNKETQLVVYNNALQSTEGTINITCAFSYKENKNNYKITKNISEIIGVKPEENEYLIFVDLQTGLEYIRNTVDIFNEGLHFKLSGYQHHVFSKFQIFVDHKKIISPALYQQISDQGINNIEDVITNQKINYLHFELNKILKVDSLKSINGYLLDKSLLINDPEISNNLRYQYSKILDCIVYYWDHTDNYYNIISNFLNEFDVLGSFANNIDINIKNINITENLSEFNLHDQFNSNPDSHIILYFWILVGQFGKLIKTNNKNIDWFCTWKLDALLYETLINMDIDYTCANELIALLPILIELADGFNPKDIDSLDKLLEKWLKNETIKHYLLINDFNNIKWFNYERAINFIYALKITSLFNIQKINISEKERTEHKKHIEDLLNMLIERINGSEYQVKNLL